MGNQGEDCQLCYNRKSGSEPEVGLGIGSLAQNRK